MKIDKSIIKELSNYLDEFNLNEIEITEKDTKIKVSKNNVSISSQPAQISTNIQTGNQNVSEKPSVKLSKKLLHQLLELFIMPQNLEQKNLLRWVKKLKKVTLL